MPSPPSPPIDVARARAETPGCTHVAHFNNAGAALMPQPVLDAVSAHLQAEALTGGYEAVSAAHGAVERVYDAVAALLSCHRDEIAIVENATRAWDMAFYSLLLQPGDRILTARAEMETRALDAVVRASVHYYNSDEELARLYDALRSIGAARWHGLS